MPWLSYAFQLLPLEDELTWINLHARSYHVYIYAWILSLFSLPYAKEASDSPLPLRRDSLLLFNRESRMTRAEKTL